MRNPGDARNRSYGGLDQNQVRARATAALVESAFQPLDIIYPADLRVSGALRDFGQVNPGAYRWLGSSGFVDLIVQNHVNQVTRAFCSD